MADAELIFIPKETALTVFSADDGLEPFMQKIRAEIDAFVPDISTKKGRDAVASIAHKVAKSKTYLDGVGKDLVAGLKDLPKKIDASRKTMRDTLDEWKDEVRLPLTEWELAEDARINHHKSCIEAGHAKASALASLNAALIKREKYDAEQTELARLRAESEARAIKDREDQIAREAAERATKEAEASAQRERDAEALKAKQLKDEVDRRELEQNLALERAEREKAEALLAAERAQKDAERRAQEAVEAEQRRVADEAAKIAAEAKAREKDRSHKASINQSAMAAFIAGGLSEECAKLAVTLIAKRSIPSISIAY